MFEPVVHNEQSPLPFDCAACIQRALQRCSGPVSHVTYNMRGQSLVTCSDVQRREMLFADLYGRVMSVPQRSFHDLFELPPFIPGIGDRLDRIIQLPPKTVVAISLETFLNESGLPRFKSSADLIKGLRLPNNIRLALINTAKDQKLERFWTKSDSSDLWKRIAEFNFYFVTSLTFSVYDENPRADHIFNQDRNLITNDQLTSLGIPSVPFLYPFNDEDYEDAFEWLRERPDITKIAVLAQFYKSRRQFRQFLHNMRILRDGINRAVQFLVVGVAKLERIEAVMAEFDAAIVSWKPFDCAVFGGVGINSRLDAVPKAAVASLLRVKIAEDNIQKFTHTCHRLRLYRNRFVLEASIGMRQPPTQRLSTR